VSAGRRGQCQVLLGMVRLLHARQRGNPMPWIWLADAFLLEVIAEITGLLAGNGPAPPARRLRLPVEPLSESELRVLRYLPTNLTGPEIANELYVSPNTVKTHVRNLYAKLGPHRRAEAVTRARNLGLLAPSPRSAR
jgi:DNA-binding NarL/FixJ family response regulator